MDHTATAKMALQARPMVADGPRDKPLYLHLLESSFSSLAEFDGVLDRLHLRVRPVSASHPEAGGPELTTAHPSYSTELESMLGNLLEQINNLRHRAEGIVEAVQL